MKAIMVVSILSAGLGCSHSPGTRMVLGGAHPPTSKVECVMVGEPKVDRSPVPMLPLEAVVTYPFGMRRAGIRGSVVIRLLIDESGKVASSAITRSSQPEFEPAVIDSVSMFRFFPASVDGKAVA